MLVDLILIVLMILIIWYIYLGYEQISAAQVAVAGIANTLPQLTTLAASVLTARANTLDSSDPEVANRYLIAAIESYNNMVQIQSDNTNLYSAASQCVDTQKSALILLDNIKTIVDQSSSDVNSALSYVHGLLPGKTSVSN